MTARAAALVASLALAGPSAAQDHAGLGWGDLIAPDRLAQIAAQYAIQALRTQVDLKYGDLAISLATGRLSLTDIRVWPFPDWDQQANCVVRIDRLAIRLSPPSRLDRNDLVVDAYGVDAPLVCLPPELRMGLLAAGRDRLSFGHASVDFSFRIPESSADLHLVLDLDGIASVTLDAAFSYLSVYARGGPENSYPVAYLASAALTVADRGGWVPLSAALPPVLVDPQDGPDALAGRISAMLADRFLDPGQAPDSHAAAPLIDSIAAAWGHFLERPTALTLLTGFDPKRPVFLDFEYYAERPFEAFADLEPLIVYGRKPVTAGLDRALVESVLDAPDAASHEQRRSVGLALLRGEGAPRSVSHALALLAPLTEAGDASVALALALALEPTEPEQAYRLALDAGAAGLAGATSLLDRLESRLPFATVLALQPGAPGSLPDRGAMPPDARTAQARARLTGRGAARSYALAAYHARLLMAEGLAEGDAILDDIDSRASAAGPQAYRDWTATDRAQGEMALRDWLDR